MLGPFGKAAAAWTEGTADGKRRTTITEPGNMAPGMEEEQGALPSTDSALDRTEMLMAEHAQTQVGPRRSRATLRAEIACLWRDIWEELLG